MLKKYLNLKNIILFSAKSILQFFTAILVPKFMLNYLYSFIPEDIEISNLSGDERSHVLIPPQLTRVLPEPNAH